MTQVIRHKTHVQAILGPILCAVLYVPRIEDERAYRRNLASCNASVDGGRYLTHVC